MNARSRSEPRRRVFWTAWVVALAMGFSPAVSFTHVHGPADVEARAAGADPNGPPPGTALCQACRAAQQHAQLPLEPADAARALESSGTLAAEAEVGRPNPRHHRESPRAPPADRRAPIV